MYPPPLPTEKVYSSYSLLSVILSLRTFLSPPLHCFSLVQPSYLRTLLAMAAFLTLYSSGSKGWGCAHAPNSNLLVQKRVLQDCLTGLKQYVVSPFWTMSFVCPPPPPRQPLLGVISSFLTAGFSLCSSIFPCAPIGTIYMPVLIL